MNVIIVADYSHMSRKAADIVADCVRDRRTLTLGLPTGNTPRGMYGELVRMYRDDALDFSGVTTFTLDEYRGIPADHPAAFGRYIQTNFLDHVNVPPAQSYWPDATGDADEACRAYEEAIRAAGGFDLVVLGIGTNGHIAFNEPGTPFDSRTHIARLAEQTRRIAADGKTFSRLEDVPELGITIGIGTIMDATHVLLLASGAGKADAVAAAVAGPVTEQLPASVLQRHPRVTLVIDEAAAAQLPRQSA